MAKEGDISIKICGMRDADNIVQVASFNPDYMGFIAYPGSPRFIGRDFIMPAVVAVANTTRRCICK